MKNVKPIFASTVLFVLVSMAPFAADPSRSPKFRADDGSVFRIWDNPALIAALDKASLGVQVSPIQSVLANSSSNRYIDALIAAPSLAYGLSAQGDTLSFRIGSAIGFGDIFSLGYADRYYFAATGGRNEFALGSLFRPLDFLSLGLSYEYTLDREPGFGFGLGFRPLAFIPELAPCLTLTADARYGSSFVFESLGAHLAFGDSFSLRGWWDFENSRPGAELSVSFGLGETGVRTSSLQSPWVDDIGMAQIVHLPRIGTSPDLGGRKILLVKDLASLSSTPAMNAEIPFLDFGKADEVQKLCDRIQRAAKDASVAALLFEDFPVIEYPSDSQELAGAIEEFRKAGKKFYVYADSIQDPSQYEILLALADKIVLNPLGQLMLVGKGGTQLYMKGLFDKLGIKFINFAPWPTKSAYNSFSSDSMPQEERAMVERYLGELQDQGNAALEKGRAGRLAASAKELVDRGPYMNAGDALKAGLVDSLEYRLSFEDALKKEYQGASFVEDLPVTGTNSWGPSLLRKRVALVWCAGNIEAGEGTKYESIGQSAAKELKRLREDPFTAGIILRVDSGGGSALTSDVIAEEVRKTVEAGKPVAVSMGDLAASGGYYISAYAERIFADPGTLTGSIGVTGLSYNFQGLLDKLGLKPESVATSPSTLFLSPFEDPRPEDAKAIDDYVFAIYDRFIEVVAKGRKLDAGKVRAIGEGRIWTGREALALGLVDELGGLEATKAWMEKRLGAKADFFEVVPGPDTGFSGFMREAAAETMKALDLDRGSASAALEEIAGPALRKISSLLKMGRGALYYCPAAAGLQVH